MIGAFKMYMAKARGGTGVASASLCSKAQTLANVLLRQLAMSALTAGIVPQPALSKPRPQPRAEAAASKVWRARYVGGSITIERRGRSLPLPEQSRVRVRFEEGRILVFKKKRLISIPASAVAELDYRAEGYSRSRQVFGPQGAGQAIGNCAAGDPQAGVVCVMVGLPLYAATAPFHYREHFIHITWREGSSAGDADSGEEEEMELRVGKGEYHGLIAALERATGKRCERIKPNDSGQAN